MKYLKDHNPGVKAWNFGTGTGSTVLEVIDAFSSTIGHKLNVKYEARRDGDVPNLTAKNDLAREELGWVAKHSLQEACEDLWLWTENNPDGYRQPLSKELLAKLATAKKTLDEKRKARK
jgi:UDP-glucose 4-epimerase